MTSPERDRDIQWLQRASRFSPRVTTLVLAFASFVSLVASIFNVRTALVWARVADLPPSRLLAAAFAEPDYTRMYSGSVILAAGRIQTALLQLILAAFFGVVAVSLSHRTALYRRLVSYLQNNA